MAVVLTGYCMIALISGGATCVRKKSTIPEFRPPTVFTKGTPTLDQVIAQTNRSLSINSLSSNSLTIKVPEIAYSLSGTFRWERPDRFKLDTKVFSSMMGTPIAAGSNSEYFWLQSSRPTPTIYFAKHEEFENQHGPRAVLPVSPLWLREAFGVIEMDSQWQHQGPFPRADGKLEILSHIPSARGMYRRALVMSADSGTIEETHLEAPSGKLVASARMSNHQYYSAINWSLPHKVQIRLLPDVGDEIVFTVEVGFYQTNETFADRVFEFPDTTGMTQVDLVRKNNVQYQQTSISGAEQSGNSSLPTYQVSSSNGPSDIGLAPQINGVRDSNMPSNNMDPLYPTIAPASTEQPPAVSAPIYRTDKNDRISLQNWQGNLKR